MKREKWIDNAKGIAILLVILGHTGNRLTSNDGFAFVYGVHLVVFFILSGYTLKKKTINKDYLNARFSRLMTPYFYTCFAILITDLFNCWRLNHDLSITGITEIIGADLVRSFFASGYLKTFGSIDIGTRIGAIWFLPAIFFATLLFQFLLSKTENDKLLGLLTSAIALTGYYSAKFLWLPFSIQSAMFSMFFIWIGYEIKKHDVLAHLRCYHYLIAQIVLLFGIYHGYCEVGFVYADMKDLFLSIPVGIAGCLLVYLLSRADSKGAVLAYIGRISLTILCVHLYALNTLSPHIRLLLERTSLTGNKMEWTFIAIHVLFAVFAAALIDVAKKTLSRPHQAAIERFHAKIDTRRDLAIDVAKGILILSMILGHYAIDLKLRCIIFSCHMMAFVIFSGYFFRSGATFSNTLRKTIRTFLLPYAGCAVLSVLLDRSLWSRAFFKESALRYLLGMSYSKNILVDIPSVGPVYFVLMLFVVRLIYVAIDRTTKTPMQRTIAVICVSVLGLTLGKEGWWLPWSFDIACYAVVFYYIGIQIREHQVLKTVREWNVSYFILSPVWAFMIYRGSMEIAVRNYGDYGVVILGAVAGTLVVYQLSAYIAAKLPLIAKLLDLAGKHTIYILIVHTVLPGMIHSFVARRFDPDYTAFMICSMLIQVVIGILIGEIISRLKKGASAHHKAAV